MTSVVPAGREPDPLVLLRRLTSRDRFILRTLADHQVLTTSQVGELAFGSLRAAQQRLAGVCQILCARGFSLSGSRHLKGAIPVSRYLTLF